MYFSNALHSSSNCDTFWKAEANDLLLILRQFPLRRSVTLRTCGESLSRKSISLLLRGKSVRFGEHLHATSTQRSTCCSLPRNSSLSMSMSQSHSCLLFGHPLPYSIPTSDVICVWTSWSAFSPMGEWVSERARGERKNEEYSGR